MSVKLKTAVDRIAVGLTRLVLRHRLIVLLGSLLVALGIGFQASHLTFGNNYRVFFSKANPELQAFESFQNTYTKNDNVFIFVKPRDDASVFRPEVMQAVAELTEGGWQIPHSIRVDSVTNFQHTYAIEDDLIVEDLIDDPTALSPEEFADKRRIALAEPLLKGQLVTADARATAVNVVLQYPEKELDEVPNVAAAARALRDRVAEAYPDLDIRLTGVGMLNVSFAESGIKDYSTIVPLMFLLVLALTFVTLRSFSATVIVTTIIVLSLMVTMGSGGWMRVQLTPISLSAMVVVLTLAVADSIHILLALRNNLRLGLDKHTALLEAIRVNFLAVCITSVTTVVGFLVLNTSDAPPFWHLGNMSAIGIAAAWLFSILTLPALVSLLPFKVKAQPQAEGARTSLMERFGRYVVAHKASMAGIAVSLGLMLVLMIPRLEFNDMFTKYFDNTIPFRPASDIATEHFGLYPIEFSIPAKEPGGVSEPDYLQRLYDFAVWLRQREEVAHVYAISDIMQRLNKNLNADDPAFYRLPEDRELSAQYLLLYELSLPYGLDLNDRINIDKSATRVTATLDDVSTADTKAFLNAARTYIATHFPEYAQAKPTSAAVMFTYVTDRNVEQMIRGTLIAIIAISAVMILALRSVRLGLLSLIPNALPILCAFGLWALVVGEVGFSIAVIGAISLGIVVDDTVHFMTKYLRARRENDLSPEDAVRYAFVNVGPAILINTFILAMGFGLLTFSSFKLTADMGLLTASSILFAAVLDFLMLPALLIWVDRATSTTTTHDHETLEPAHL